MQTLKTRSAKDGAKRRAAANQVSGRVTRTAKSEAAEWQELDAAIDAIGAKVEELHRQLDDATRWLHR